MEETLEPARCFRLAWIFPAGDRHSSTKTKVVKSHVRPLVTTVSGRADQRIRTETNLETPASSMVTP